VGAQKIEQSESFCAPTASRLSEMRQDSKEKPVHKIRGANTCRFFRGRETIFLLNPKDEKKNICLVTEYPGGILKISVTRGTKSIILFYFKKIRRIGHKTRFSLHSKQRVSRPLFDSPRT
jgi:hypothetical protein